MKRLQLFLLMLTVSLAACSSVDKGGTIAQLRNVEIEIEDEPTEGGLEKAIASYQHFLEAASGSAMAPEAIRRLADLKVEKEYGVIAEAKSADQGRSEAAPQEPASPSDLVASPVRPDPPAVAGQAEGDFEGRASGSPPFSEGLAEGEDPKESVDDLERAGALEAVALYRKLLKDYPLYRRNDHVLYQLSRAYEELGRIEEAMEVMDQLVENFSDSRYIDEVQFRRAEYFFTHRRFLEAEEAYGSIVDIGVGSSYYLLALYKLGWTFYKQELYEEALHKFVALLDYKLSVGYDFAQTEDDLDGKRVQDTFRIISLSFSYLGGADSVAEYFSRQGGRLFEDSIYGHLAEYYVNKRRYSDAVATYEAFVERNPFHRKAPHFQMRVIEINVAGGFPSLVIDAKKAFANNYAMGAAYWNHFDPEDRPEVLQDLKTNLTDLANHYHALYRNPKFADKKPLNFVESLRWYRAFLASFPQAPQSPAVNYQLADLLLENRVFADAALEYEKTAYDYPLHEQSSKAGYAAVYAFRQHLARVAAKDKNPVKREVVRSSLKFAEAFPEHEKAPVVQAAAADDLYALADFQAALAAARNLIERFPGADAEVRRSAWLVAAHSSYELESFAEAEGAYVEVLSLLEEGDKSRQGLVDNLAASIYKQGEQANILEDYCAAADHFLRVATMAPTSTFRATAEYDGATALIKLKEWGRAATVLAAFRKSFPEHKLQHEVTKKIAYVFRADGQFSQAAEEYERIERETDDDELRREVLLIAAELHEKVGDSDRTLLVYRRYVQSFPRPVDMNVETRNKIAEILKQQDKRDEYLKELRKIVALDAAAGAERTDRTRFFGGHAALVLAETGYERFVAINLVKPFETNLRLKQKLMKTATQDFAKLLDYEIGEVTAAATYYMAEIYGHFSESLMASERPEGLSALELEEYELAIEEQAYPFEEKAIEVHQSNLELLSMGIYNPWIENSLGRLAEFVPARYAKPEEENVTIAPLEVFSFEIAGSTTVAGTGTPVASAESPDSDGASQAGGAEPDPDQPGGNPSTPQLEGGSQSEIAVSGDGAEAAFPGAGISDTSVDTEQAGDELTAELPQNEPVQSDAPVSPAGAEPGGESSDRGQSEPVAPDGDISSGDGSE